MTMPMVGLAAVAYLAASAFWTQQDPFVGKWTLDVSRSTIVDRMEVRSVGPNRYAFNFEGAPTETVLADGTDQPGLPGTTLSVRSEDARSLKVVRKQDGHVIVSADWKLARDGRTLRDDFANAQPDGSTVVIHYLYRRAPGTAGASGFAGAWESTTKPLGVKLELAIAPYAGQGLTFTSPGSVKSVTFDGRDHALPGASEGQTAAGHRRGPRTLDYTEGDHGKVQHTRQFALSPDGRTLTETLRTPGEKTPNVLVFARE